MESSIESNRQLKILWVKMGGLWPLNTGGRLRTFHIVSQLSREHRVTLLTTHSGGDDPEALTAQLPDCERVASIPCSPPKYGSIRFPFTLARSWLSPLPVDLWKNRVGPLKRRVSRLLQSGEFDLCVADFLFAVPNVPLGGPTPVVFFAHNVEHMIWKRLCDNQSGALKRALLEVEWRKMRRYEALACRRADLTIAVSKKDRDQLGALAPGIRSCAIPTGVDVSYFVPNGARESRSRVVFSGSMDWHPNEDAILHFIDSILPTIRDQVPGVTVTVVGRNPSTRLMRAASAAPVQITGTVEDIRPYVAEAAVYVVPLRIGGGTRLKIFEALAMGKAVVSTSIGAEGLPLVDGEHFIRADAPADFARAVVSLLQDPQRRKELGATGRQLVQSRFSWPMVARDFESRCRELAA